MREALTALAVVVPFALGLTAAEPAARPDPLFRFVDPAIVESSGLAVLDGPDGLVATVNDSGDSARVFVVDPRSGQTVGVTRWQGEPTDVEALAPAGDGEVWVADIGDNTSSREAIAATRVQVGEGEHSVAGSRVLLTYPDGPADAEALLAHPETGRLVVVTKGIFGGEVYVAPRQLASDRPNRVSLRGRVMPVVTDGAFLPDGDHLVLRDYGRAVVYTWPGLEAVGEVELPEQRQGEGIAVTGNGTVLISSEGQQAPVYEVELPTIEPEATEPTTDPGTDAPGTARPEHPAEEPVGQRDPTQWLLGTGLLVVAGLVLWLALRPTTKLPHG